MKYIKAYEKEDRITVKIKPNTKDKSKWYYGWINYKNDMTGKIITVKKSYNPTFDNCYRYDDSHYIDIEDCEYIGNGCCRRMNLDEIKYWSKDKRDLQSILKLNKYNL